MGAAGHTGRKVHPAGQAGSNMIDILVCKDQSQITDETQSYIESGSLRPTIISFGEISAVVLDNDPACVRLGAINDAVLASIGAGAIRDKAKIAAAATSTPIDEQISFRIGSVLLVSMQKRTVQAEVSANQSQSAIVLKYWKT